MRKKKERLEYAEWSKEKEDPSFGMYIITGAVHWKKEFVEGLMEVYDCKYELVNKDIEETLKKAKYKPMGKRKHIIMYEPLDRISNVDLNNIVQYSRKLSKHAILVVSINDWRDKKKILNNFRYIENSKTIKLMDLDFPTNKFLEDYIREVSRKNNLEFESKDVMNLLVRRISSSPEEIVANIETLASFTTKVDKESVLAYTEDYSSYNYNKLYETITQLNRVRVPFISYNDLQDSGKKDITIMINIRKHLEKIYQAKYLKQKGILRPRDIIDMKKPLYDKGDFKFNEPNIWNESNYKINKYIEESEGIPLKDILYCMDIIDRNLKSVGYMIENNGKGREEKEGKRRVVVPEEGYVIYRTLLELLDRRDEEYEFEE